MKVFSKYFISGMCVFLCFLVQATDSIGFGRGFFLRYGYGELNLENSSDQALHNSFGVGVFFDTNISRKKLFNYRIALTGNYNFINHYRYEDFWYYNWNNEKDEKSEKMFFDDEGWGASLSHSFLFGIVREPRYRLSIGPSVKLGYNQFFGLENRSWIYRTIGFGPEVSFNYHVNRKTTLSLILNYYGEQNFVSEISSYTEEVYCFKVAYIFRSASEAIPMSDESSSAAAEAGMSSMTTPLARTEPVQTIGEFGKQTETGSLAVRCFPHNCQVGLHKRVFDKETSLMVITDVPAGEYNLSFTWTARTVKRKIAVSKGGSQLITAHRDAAHINIQRTECLRFLDNGDGTLTDVFSYLQWATIPIAGTFDLNEAQQLIRKVSIASHTDWRLPTIMELEDLVTAPHHPCSTEKTGPIIALPSIFSLDRSACWSSSEGEHSVLMAGAPVWFMNFRTGKREWSVRERKRQILPVRWTSDGSIFWKGMSDQALGDAMSKSSTEILGEGIPLLSATEFRDRVFETTQPTAVLFLKEGAQGVDGVCQVFRYLKQTFAGGINFYAHIIGPEVSDLFSTILNSEVPATIALYTGIAGRISMADTYSGLVHRPEIWKQKYIQLGLWMYDKMIGKQYGVLYQGHYIHISFSGTSEPQIEIIEDHHPTDFSNVRY